ncbi:MULTISPECIES: mandelate racemase/muconate lactonizing enzyme family protein [Streptomyces]|uniref:Mandelate racemase/muconate lactonizing enzyme family protein n=1 Tax=Streptomyces lonegramiae TaxID=3075524 RepID=A0ABU2XNK8_9ACTN|nr:mandelate racemase/muconate lactonizing enzyme family protein [Streptomyces sp. DSM 41529]MDT0547524.1 mandelate racemase/muconate lactonizing enzyme family protein [Streptomyces sp. DSM 41529]
MTLPSTVSEQAPWASGASGLTITGVDVVAVRAPLAREFKGSFYRMTHRATLITRVRTEEGIVGEAYVGDEDGALAEIAAITTREIAPRLIGEDAFATERCWDLAYPVTYDILRDRRHGLVALAGVDTAIWDAVGKALWLPLHRLWGGYRREIPLMAIGGYYGEPLGAIEDEIAFYKDRGLAGMKFKVGGASPEVDAKRVAAAREAAGDDFVITVDANQGYTVAEALEFAWRVEDLGIRWFEEPVRWHNDRRSLRDVRMRTRIPVAAGQSEYSASGCRDLMEAGAIDVCNFDASWSGGPTAWRRAAAIAISYDVQMGHHEEPQVAAHLLASQSHGTYAECFHPDRDPFWWHLIATERRLVDGKLQLSDAPGLGWELDEDYIAGHRLELGA